MSHTDRQPTIESAAGARRHGPLASLQRLKRTLKRRHKGYKADVLVVSHAKSGRTWLATMLSHVYIRRYGLPENEAVQFDRLRKRDKRVPNIVLSHDNQKGSAKVPLFKAEKLARHKIVLLVRHPCDVAVSAYHQSLRDGRKGLEPDHAGRPLFDYVVQDKLPTVLTFLQRWQGQLDAMDAALVIRYEDLHAQPAVELARLLSFIEGAADPAEIEAAVAFGAFEQMRRREAEGYFMSDRLRPGDAGDPRSFKVREGRTGGYRERFTAAELARIDALLAEADLAAFGYAPGCEVEEFPA